MQSWIAGSRRSFHPWTTKRSNAWKVRTRPLAEENVQRLEDADQERDARELVLREQALAIFLEFIVAPVGSAPEQRHCIFVAQPPLLNDCEERRDRRRTEARASGRIRQVRQLSKVEANIRNDSQSIHGVLQLWSILYPFLDLCQQAVISFVFQRIQATQPSRNLPAQLVQIVVALRDALERILRLVVLNDVMLDSRLFGLRENLLPIDNAAADRGQVHGVAEVLRTPSGDRGKFL